jgi:hypothetical protein
MFLLINGYILIVKRKNLVVSNVYDSLVMILLVKMYQNNLEYDKNIPSSAYFENVPKINNETKIKQTF